MLGYLPSLSTAACSPWSTNWDSCPVVRSLVGFQLEWYLDRQWALTMLTQLAKLTMTQVTYGKIWSNMRQTSLETWFVGNLAHCAIFPRPSMRCSFSSFEVICFQSAHWTQLNLDPYRGDQIENEILTGPPHHQPIEVKKMQHKMSWSRWAKTASAKKVLQDLQDLHMQKCKNQGCRKCFVDPHLQCHSLIVQFNP